MPSPTDLFHGIRGRIGNLPILLGKHTGNTDCTNNPPPTNMGTPPS
jgi:hypothetical protein